MKLLLVTLLLSTLLFSAQKQIIVGCYSVNSNAKNALGILKKQIDANENLKQLIAEKSLQIINTDISNYTVVSVNYFDSAADTYEVMKALKPYYDDIYYLRYPIPNSNDKEYLKDMKEEVNKEIVIEKELVEAQNIKQEETIEVEEIIEVVETEIIVESMEATSTPSDSMFEEEKQIVEESDSWLDNKYLMIGLVLLFLIIGGIIVSRQFKDKDTKE